jgi:DNA polymerase III delta prime subunit
MEPSTLLKTKGIKPEDSVLLISAEEALENILETIDDYCPNLEIDKMTKEDISTLLKSYAECVIDYHPESRHQERVVLLKNFEMLKQYGLTDDDYEALDFC